MLLFLRSIDAFASRIDSKNLSHGTKLFYKPNLRNQMSTAQTPCMFTLIKQFDSLNHKALLEVLVKRDPNLLVLAAASVENLIPAVWMSTVMDYIKDEKYLWAIKLVRDSTGLGLRDSMDVVDSLRNINGMGTISNESRVVVEQFKAANFAFPTPAVKPEPKIEGVYIVCEYSDNTIDSIFADRDAAYQRQRYMESAYVDNSVYVTYRELS